MQLPRFVTLVIGIGATFALALPAAGAAPDRSSEREDRVPDNPVAHCLPGEFEDGDSVDDEAAQCVLGSLPDVVGSPHAASVVAVVANGIAQGKTDGTYGVQDAVTRGQMATFLSRALDLRPSEHAELPDDVGAGSPHADAIAAVIEDGIAQGKADGSYGPQEAVTRGQMATFLDRALDLPHEAGDEIPEDAKGSAHEQAIEAVIENTIALGFTDGTFRPGEAVTRGQMASFLTRALDL